jgi:hypothetical protein
MHMRLALALAMVVIMINIFRRVAILAVVSSLLWLPISRFRFAHTAGLYFERITLRRRFVVELIEELVSLVGSDYRPSNINNSSDHCSDGGSGPASSRRIGSTPHNSSGRRGVIARRICAV